jgi:tetratricopeptide (TPR) repeat protein
VDLAIRTTRTWVPQITPRAGAVACWRAKRFDTPAAARLAQALPGIGAAELRRTWPSRPAMPTTAARPRTPQRRARRSGGAALSVRVLARHDRGRRRHAGRAWSRAPAQGHERPPDSASARLLSKQPDLAFARPPRDRDRSRLPGAAGHAGEVQEDRGQRVEAEKTWTELQRRYPDHNGVAFDLAAARERLGDLPGAEAAVRDVLKRELENATALNFLGYLWADHNLRLTEAVELIERALAQDPENGAYVDSLGWAYYRLGRLSEARIQLERAVALSRGDPIVLEHLGDLYKDMALKDLAIHQYERSLAADPSNSRVQAKLEALR